MIIGLFRGLGRFTAQYGWWLIIAALIVLAILLPIHTFFSSWPEGARGGFSGSAVGVAGILLGFELQRLNERRKGWQAAEEKRRKLATLISVELRDVAIGVIELRQQILMVLGDKDYNFGEDTRFQPPKVMSLTEGLKTELLVFDEQTIDHVALLISLVGTLRRCVQEYVGCPGGRSRLKQVDERLIRLMNKLADAFELMAPKQAIQLHKWSQAYPIMDALRHVAKQEIYLNQWSEPS